MPAFYNGKTVLIRNDEKIAPFAPINFIVDAETEKEATKLYVAGAIITEADYKAHLEKETVRAEVEAMIEEEKFENTDNEVLNVEDGATEKVDDNKQE